MFLQPWYKYHHPTHIGKIIFDEIPNQNMDIELYKIIASIMIHGPCGAQNRRSPCMKNGKCTWYFPRKIVENITFDADRYSLHRRRDTGQIIKKEDCVINNKYVIPYNRYLLLKYNVHINLKLCNQSRSIKYLFKYMNKENVQIVATFYESVDTQ